MSMKVPFVALDRQYHAYKQEIDEAFQRVASQGMYVGGEDVEHFEKELAKICGVKHALTVGNGTDALVIAMKALGLKAGDEVITAPNSFIATAGGINQIGARPIFCDVAEDHNIDPSQIERHITNKTRAIVPIHLTGHPADMDPIREIAKDRGLVVIEDAAQAIGATYKGKPVGGLGDAGAFSLHPLKNIFVLGDGGFISTSNSDQYEIMKKLRNHGLKDRDTCEFWGQNSRLDTLHCAIGLVKLKYFDHITARFREIAKIYRDALKDLVIVPEEADDIRAVYHNFVICTPERDDLKSYLAAQGVETKMHYPILLHKQPAAADLGYEDGRFPVAEKLNRQQLSLPIFPELTDNELDYVIKTISSYFGGEKNGT